MSVGKFTDRDEALAAVDELLAPGTDARLLVVFGVTGQGKTRLLERVAELYSASYRPQLVDLQQVANRSGKPVPAGVDDFAVLLLRDLGAALARQARWWQRPSRLVRRAGEIGGGPMPPSVHAGQTTDRAGKIINSPLTVVVGGPVVDTVRRGMWISQLTAVARRLRRSRLLLLVDTCEWMAAFDEPPPSGPGLQTAGGVGLSPWFLRQVLPALLDAAPRLKVVLAGWDRLDLGLCRVTTLPAQELTGWTHVHTKAFLTSSGIDDEAVADLVHAAGDGLPLLAAVVAEEAHKWRAADGTVDTAALTVLIRDRPAARWVPELILARLTPAQSDEIAAAAVLRTVTAPALQALLPDHDERAGTGWFTRLAGRSFLQELPDAVPGGRRWRMHGQVRRWLLGYLANTDSITLSGRQVLSVLHQRAAAYYADLAVRSPQIWQADIVYHRFALGDDTSTASWRRQILAAAHAGQLADVAALVEVALAPEQDHIVRTRLPAVAATALACAAWLAYQRGDLADAEHHAVGAAGLYQHAGSPDGRAWAWQLAGQAAWVNWRWTHATDYWLNALHTTTPAVRLAVLVALAEATLGCGDLPAARSLLDDGNALLRDHPTPAGETGPADPATPPAIPLASAVPAERLAVRLALLAADAALRSAELPDAAMRLDQVGPQATHLDDQVDLLRLRAELALASDQPLEAARLAQDAAARTAAGNDSTQRVGVLLTQAAAAHRLSTYGSPPALGTSLQAGGGQTRTPSLADRYAETALGLAADTGNRHARACALQALNRHDQARSLFEQIGDRRGQAQTLVNLGYAAVRGGDHAAADKQHGAALVLFEQVGDPRGQAQALVGLGNTALGRGDYITAEEHCGAALVRFEQIGDRRGQAEALSMLGESTRARGDYITAEEHCGAALVRFEQIGDRRGQAHTMVGLGRAAWFRGDYAAATGRYGAARALCEQIGDQGGHAYALCGLADAELAQGKYTTADKHHAAALVLFEQVADQRGQGYALRGLGESARLRGDDIAAALRFAASHGRFKKIGDRSGQAVALRGLGATARKLGDYANADTHFRATLVLFKETGDRLGQAEALSGLGDTAGARGDYAAANEHYGAALALYEQIGNPLGQAQALERIGKTARLHGDDDQARAQLARAADLYDMLSLTDLAGHVRQCIFFT